MYLSGTKHQTIADDLASGRIGLLRTPANGYRLDGIAVWALDNGCFTKAYPGDDAYLALLDKLGPYKNRCLFVAAPDVVGDAEATLDHFERMAPRIAEKGWPVALVGQDGMEHLPAPWYAVDWLFLGGSTGWKVGRGGAALIMQARERSIPVHVGRVNSARRFAYFHALGCVSSDGTFLAFGPEANAPHVRSWLRAAAQPRLWSLA